MAERRLLTTQDWIGVVRYRVNFFVLEKFARLVRTSNLKVYASMRGNKLDEFFKTRRDPDAR